MNSEDIIKWLCEQTCLWIMDERSCPPCDMYDFDDKQCKDKNARIWGDMTKCPNCLEKHIEEVIKND